MDRLLALTVFRRAAELGSFVATARDLGLSSSTVSKNIKELEDHLGARLFHRTTRHIALTEVGGTYLAHVVRVLDGLEEADAMVGAMHGAVRGRLRVSAPMTFSLLTLSEAIPAFLARHPELSLDLHLDDRRVDLVREGFDLAVRATAQLEDTSLVARRLTTLSHVVCASPAYVDAHGLPEHPRALREHRCVLYSLADHAHQWTFARGREEVSVPIVGTYRVTSSLAVRDALRAGFGISLIPRRYVADDLACGRLVTALDGWETEAVPMYAIYPSRTWLEPKVRAFVDFLVRTLAGGQAEGAG